MRKVAVVALVVLASVVLTANALAESANADDRAKILGTWKLVSYELEIQATGAREFPKGKNATGYMIFTPEGRNSLIITGEGRNAPKTDQDRADLFKSMFAYTGMYRLEGDKYITTIDVSWNPGYAKEQVRYFRFEGDRLHIVTAWVKHGDLGMGRGVLTWERAK